MLPHEGPPALGQGLEIEPEVHAVEGAGIVPARDLRVEHGIVQRIRLPQLFVLPGQGPHRSLQAVGEGVLHFLPHFSGADVQEALGILAEDLFRLGFEFLFGVRHQAGGKFVGGAGDEQGHRPALAQHDVGGGVPGLEDPVRAGAEHAPEGLALIPQGEGVDLPGFLR